MKGLILGLGLLPLFYILLGSVSTLPWILMIILFALSSKKNRILIYVILRDLRMIKKLLAIKLKFNNFEKNGLTVPKLFRQWVQKHPNKVMFRFEDTNWTFEQVEHFSNQVANYFSNNVGLQQGDNVALVMENRIEYVPIWLGLLKIGVTSSLVNNNLIGQSLIHCIMAGSPKGIIFGGELDLEMSTIRKDLPEGVKVFRLRDRDNKINDDLTLTDLDAELKKASKLPAKEPKNMSIYDKALLIYTSGTTGLPKAAVINHYKIYLFTIALCKVYNISYDEVVYVALPLYHSNGGLVGATRAVILGSTVVIRRKFSAKAFWADCIKYQCTMSIYIGEVCRFLLATQPSPEDSQHRIKVMVGNGLRSHIWQQFMDRFHIRKICEFYGSTEGIGNLVNNSGKVGAVGYLWYMFPPVRLLKMDPETEEPLRNAEGLCIEVSEPGEPGLHVAEIKEKIVDQRFEGYVDEKSTEKKVIHNIIKHGDRFYISGDLFVMDELRNLYFYDRTGDTFRWRGENVSTAEIEAVISDIIGLKDLAVYGIQVPGEEGRAGMVSIVTKDLDLDYFTKQLRKKLPKYARPLFVRLIKEMPITGTFKLKKKILQADGYDPTKVSDDLFVFDVKSDQYVRINKDLHEKILNKQFAF